MEPTNTTLNEVIINPRERWNKLYDRSSYLGEIWDWLDARISEIINWQNVPINPRERWNKLYDRSSSLGMPLDLLTTQETINTELFGDSDANTALNNCLESFESRDLLNQLDGEQATSLHPVGLHLTEPSVERSGALCNITFLCRDVICECNNCTTECTYYSTEEICDACSIQRFVLFAAYTWDVKHVTFMYSGSFIEGCMLPTFFFRCAVNKAVKIRSDIDMMSDMELDVGFNFETRNNIVFEIETEGSHPGYLRLRNMQNGAFLNEGLVSQIIGFLPDHSTSNQIRKIDHNAESMKRNNLGERRHGPALSLLSQDENVDQDMDLVYFFRCLSWPPLAKPWIDRERRYNWPSKEIIRKIVSMGCRVVQKAHEMTETKEIEYRFSFSMAESILFETLSKDQRKCFIAFKCLIKYGIHKVESNTLDAEKTVSSYCLKTIFLWACEEIPAEVWHTTDGWARCLLSMINQLYACLKSGKLPGYFIPQSNILESGKPSQELLSEIGKLRSNLTTYAAAFVDATSCFRGTNSSISHDAQVSCNNHISNQADFGTYSCLRYNSTNDKTKQASLREQLKFLQTITIKTELTRSVSFWKKEAVLRIFAKWYKQNSNCINFKPWQCLTEEMTLFDIVYLDIIHGFDVPNNVLLEYAEKESSAELICKLALCYSNDTFKRDAHVNGNTCSLHQKALLLGQSALKHTYPSLECIGYLVEILTCNGQFEIAAKVSKSAMIDLSEVERSCFIPVDLSTVVFSHKTRNELQEIFDISRTIRIGQLGLPVTAIFLYALFRYYRHIKDEIELQNMLTKIKCDFLKCIEKYIADNGIATAQLYSYILLSLEVFTGEMECEYFHGLVYSYFVTVKMDIIDHESTSCKFFSCNLNIFHAYVRLAHWVDFSEDNLEERLIRFKDRVSGFIKTIADKIYYCQPLIFGGALQEATSLLETIVEQEGDYSLSVVIWSKRIWRRKTTFLGETLREELIKSSLDYVVFPTNLYARYLLMTVYRLLGQMEQNRNNLKELNVLLQRYSEFSEFAPMLAIITATLQMGS